MTAPEHETLRWEQLPRDGGQIVEVFYAVDGEYLYLRTRDRSDMKITLDRAKLTGEGEFEPQNGVLPGHGEWECITPNKETTWPIPTCGN